MSYLIIALLFVVQVVTNIFVLVKLIPAYKRKSKPKVNISDIMAACSQIVEDKNNESV